MRFFSENPIKQPALMWALAFFFMQMMACLEMIAALAASTPGSALRPNGLRPPYQEAGWTKEEAAAHVLDRFAYGPRPGEVQRVADYGLERWLEEQLSGKLPEKDLEKRLQVLPALEMSTAEIVQTYPNPGFVLRMAAREGVISRADSTLARAEQRAKVRAYAESRGFRPQRELAGQLLAQKLGRAVYAENQLIEVLTDFWFNHFNVSITDNRARVYVLSYEREAIRPHVLGKFDDMLLATAKHPAMLLYLDNAQSTAPDSVATTMSLALQKHRNQPGLRGKLMRHKIDREMEKRQREREQVLQQIPEEFRPRRGLNENYARELLELHTLGVDGGYTQQDVIEVARAFSGWTIMPPLLRDGKMNERLERGKRAGFIQEGEFLFRADAHDAGEKIILGEQFPAGGGMEEGERVLEMLAQHPATAEHVAFKLAAKFVCDEPPPPLVERLARTFRDTNGDLRALMRALIEAPEFWQRETRGAKIKSPLELAASAARALNADIQNPRALLRWIADMGQPLYAYQAPTGYPDRASFWINSGALLQRMNFGLALAAGKIKGVSFDLLALNQGREPESAEAALASYVNFLLPARDHAATVRLLAAMVNDPALPNKVAAAAPEAQQRAEAPAMPSDELFDEEDEHAPAGANEHGPSQANTLAQVVGVILGSPGFQRR